jgi:riboflavin transporter FmnP
MLFVFVHFLFNKKKMNQLLGDLFNVICICSFLIQQKKMNQLLGDLFNVICICSFLIHLWTGTRGPLLEVNGY